jgi:UDP-N-acetylmuramate--alanine ligase
MIPARDEFTEPAGPPGGSEGLLEGLPEQVYLLGAGGAGLSGLARLLLARGHRVCGHDREASPFTEALRRLGVSIHVGASEASDLPLPAAALDDAGSSVVRPAAAIIRSAAIGDEDPQLQRARELGWVDFKYAEMLGRLAPRGRTLAVAGTHGKTTSTWMLQHALRAIADASPGAPSPGVLVGGIDATLKTNAVVPDAGGWFGVEACEYDRSFLQLDPTGALVTNVEADHLDYYGDEEAVVQAFAEFTSRLARTGLLVLGETEKVPQSVEDATGARVWRLGRELRLEAGAVTRGCHAFRLRGPGWETPSVQLAVPGEFNVQNAALALALAVGAQEVHPAGPDLQACAAAAARGLENFQGVLRRFEHWGRDLGLDLVHDYAHHPTEVRVTLGTARRVFPGAPLHVLFQPHQHSRTAHFLEGFVQALKTADRVVVADVYGARSPIDSLVAGAEDLVRALVREGVQAVHGGAPAQAAAAFAQEMTFDTAGLVLGAGDIDRIKDDLLSRLAVRSPAPG